MIARIAKAAALVAFGSVMIAATSCGPPANPNPTAPPPTASLAPTPTPVCASGAVGQMLCITPTEVRPGTTVQISGFAPNCASVTIMSSAFSGGPGPFGVPSVDASAPGGRFSTTATIAGTVARGTYPVTVRACGGNLGVEVDLQASV